MKKRIYRTAVSQRLRNTAVEFVRARGKLPEHLALGDFSFLIRDVFCIRSWGRGSPRCGEVQYGSMNNSPSSPTSSLPTIFRCPFCSCQTRNKVRYKSTTKWEWVHLLNVLKVRLSSLYAFFFLLQRKPHIVPSHIFPREGGEVLKVPELAADHSHPSSYKVTNEWSYTSALPTYLLGVNRTFAFYKTLKAKLRLVRVFWCGLKISYIIFKNNYKYVRHVHIYIYTHTHSDTSANEDNSFRITFVSRNLR